MFDSYMILNRKPKIIIIIFIYILIFFSIYIYIILNSFNFTPYYSKYSYIKLIDEDYYLKLEVELDKVDNFVEGSIIYIDNNIYKYQIYKLEEGINNDSQIIYLEVFGLNNKYKINNYSVKVKIKEKSMKLINNIFI